ncbi:hypothetical protein [Nocardia sp. SYP-A9097]|uniref:hypothetical protein n=1 Tax=Nocardia sp. SYP-A9097 TaxID=2663237 RepID=UPI00129B6040|nr:hypothetical protein [Nocardia sp. SYP-A9097]
MTDGTRATIAQAGLVAAAGLTVSSRLKISNTAVAHPLTVDPARSGEIPAARQVNLANFSLIGKPA